MLHTYTLIPATLIPATGAAPIVPGPSPQDTHRRIPADGSAASLAEAVDIMARSQLGRELPREDIDLIIRFLRTLTGVYRGQSLATRSDSEPR